jgi:hypothetical protein
VEAEINQDIGGLHGGGEIMGDFDSIFPDARNQTAILAAQRTGGRIDGRYDLHSGYKFRTPHQRLAHPACRPDNSDFNHDIIPSSSKLKCPPGAPAKSLTLRPDMQSFQ